MGQREIVTGNATDVPTVSYKSRSDSMVEAEADAPEDESKADGERAVAVETQASGADVEVGTKVEDSEEASGAEVANSGRGSNEAAANFKNLPISVGAEAAEVKEAEEAKDGIILHLIFHWIPSRTSNLHDDDCYPPPCDFLLHPFDAFPLNSSCLHSLFPSSFLKRYFHDPVVLPRHGV